MRRNYKLGKLIDVERNPAGAGTVVSVRMPRDLFESLHDEADRKGCTLSKAILDRLGRPRIGMARPQVISSAGASLNATFYLSGDVAPFSETYGNQLARFEQQ